MNTLAKVDIPCIVGDEFTKEVGSIKSDESDKSEQEKIADLPTDEQRAAARELYERFTGKECGPNFDAEWDKALTDLPLCRLARRCGTGLGTWAKLRAKSSRTTCRRLWRIRV